MTYIHIYVYIHICSKQTYKIEEKVISSAYNVHLEMKTYNKVVVKRQNLET